MTNWNPFRRLRELEAAQREMNHAIANLEYQLDRLHAPAQELADTHLVMQNAELQKKLLGIVHHTPHIKDIFDAPTESI